jgi:hypothetical protein
VAGLIVVVEAVRHHRPLEAALLGTLPVVGAPALRWLVRDLRASGQLP